MSSTPNRAGEDVVLTDVLSFDIRVFDPLAALIASGNDVLMPGDADYGRRLPRPP